MLRTQNGANFNYTEEKLSKKIKIEEKEIESSRNRSGKWFKKKHLHSKYKRFRTMPLTSVKFYQFTQLRKHVHFETIIPHAYFNI